MSSSELNVFSYMVLALVGRGGASPYELQRMARQGRIYDFAGESQYYVEPKRLAKLGYLEAHTEPGKTRERTVYRLTDKGLGALRDWAGSALSFPRLEHEALVMLLGGDLIEDADLRASVTSLPEEAAKRLPHRERYLMMGHRLSRRLLAAHLEWLDEIERELES
jgi:DNA-binding PadR family transcriptional regulator